MGRPLHAIREAWQNEVEKNVRTVLKRQYKALKDKSKERPVCQLEAEDRFCVSLRKLSERDSLYTLARVYDHAHVVLCKTSALKKGILPKFDLSNLARKLEEDNTCIKDRIVSHNTGSNHESFIPEWQAVFEMSFDHLKKLNKLSDTLPGEESKSQKYAGIGGGGGSDVISAALIGKLLERQNKEMNLLVSTRTWDTGSQGKNGSKIGVKREVTNHAGYAAIDQQGVGGTYRITAATTAEGRDLEAIPLQSESTKKESSTGKKQVYMILDQTLARSTIEDKERATLERQIEAVLAQEPEVQALMIVALGALNEKSNVNASKSTDKPTKIDTVVSVDTGGDVFGAKDDGSTTPDQDYRVQKAITNLNPKQNLVTAVVAPGVDAPDDAPDKAFRADGMVYKLDSEERLLLLQTLKEYQMDGSNENRFGKTTLALQASLRGEYGWRSLNLPEYVVNTWENPWSSFVNIQRCMSDIIFMPTKKLLPVISPKSSTVIASL